MRVVNQLLQHASQTVLYHFVPCERATVSVDHKSYPGSIPLAESPFELPMLMISVSLRYLETAAVQLVKVV